MNDAEYEHNDDCRYGFHNFLHGTKNWLGTSEGDFFFFYSSWGCTSHNIRSVNYLLISAMLYDRSITKVVEFLFFHSAIWRKTKLGEIKGTPRIWREHPALTNCADLQLWTNFNKCWSQNFLFRNTEMRMLHRWDENEIDEELKVWQRRM